MTEMAVPGRRKRGKPRRWMEWREKTWKGLGAREGDKLNGVKWRILSHCDDPE